MRTESLVLRATIFKRWRFPLLALVVLAVCGGAWSVYSKNMAQTKTNNKPNENPSEKLAVVYELAAVDVNTTELRELGLSLPISGSLTSISQVTVRSKVGAEVRETLVQEGNSVHKGQVIARFDTADLRARLVSQDASVDEAQAKLAMAKKNRLSNETLLKQNYISQNAFDTTNNSVELATASLKSATAQHQIAQLALADTEVKAPLDGIISKRSVQAGDKVSPDTPLFNIVNLSQLTLEAQVPSSEIPRIKIGQLVNFHVDGFGTRNFSGKVARINPAAETGSRSMLVYVAVGNFDAALKGGMFAKGSLTLEKSAAMPVIPIQAVRQQNGQDIIYKIVNNEVQVQKVKLGLRNEDEGLVQVLEGLSAGVNVISTKLDGVKPGNKVSLPKTVGSTAASTAKSPAANSIKG